MQCTHEALRSQAIQWMKAHSLKYADFIECRSNETPSQATQRFIQEQAKNRTWVEHPVIEALSLAQQINIVIIHPDSKPTILKVGEAVATVYLGYIPSTHYVSLHGEPPLDLVDGLNAANGNGEDTGLKQRL